MRETETKEGEVTGRAARIAKLNDAARASLGCKVVVTRGIAALEIGMQMGILALVRGFSEFSTENDPYGERDFGAIETKVGKIFWKFDYYADEGYEYGSEDPSDPGQCSRVLTIMLAEEYLKR